MATTAASLYALGKAHFCSYSLFSKILQSWRLSASVIGRLSVRYDLYTSSSASQGTVITSFSRGSSDWRSRKVKFCVNLPNSQKFRGPTESGRSQGSQQKIIRFVKNQLHILMQSQTRKSCLYWYKFIDYTVANETLEQGRNASQ